MEQTGKTDRHWLHVLIFFALTFGFGCLPPMGITPMGMKIMGVFLGMLYGWTFIGFAWPSMVCLVALGFTGYAAPGKIIGTALSHPAVLFTILVLAFTRYCDKSGINAVMARWALSRPIFVGHPWIFTCFVLVSTLIIGFLVDGVPAAFLVAGILYSLFENVKMEKGDNYPAYLLAGVFMAGVLSFACKPWAGQNLLGITSLHDLSKGAVAIDNLSVILIILPVCIAVMALYTLIIRFVFRPDISKLSNLTEEYLAGIRAQIVIGSKEKTAAIALLVFLVLMFLPNVLPKGTAAAEFFGKFNMVVAMTAILGVLSFVRVDGKAAFDFQDCSSGINWNVIWMLAASIPVSAAMSCDGAGMAKALNAILSGMVADSGSILLFLAGFLVFVNIMTQFTHNVTIVLIAMPLIWNLSQSTGMNPIGFSILLFIAAGAAYATPAASTVGALSFANGEWIGMSRAFKAGIMGCVAALAAMFLLGFPLVSAFIGI